MRSALWLTLLLPVLLGTPLSADEDSPVPWKDAVQHKTKHYRVTTNSGTEFGKVAGERLEMLYKEFFRLFGGTSVKLHDVRNLPVDVFHSRDDYKTFMGGFKPSAANSPGYYDTETGKTYSFRRYMDGEERTFDTLYHEATHQLVNLAANGCRTRERPGYWIEEGIADYFGGMRPRDGKLVPGLRAGRVAVIQKLSNSDSFLPLNEFVCCTRDGFSTEKYAQGCALMHFFLHAEDGRLRKPLFKYMSAVLKSRGQEDTFKKAFRKPASDFDEPFREYVRTLLASLASGGD